MASQTLKMRIQFRRDTTDNWLLYKDVVPYAGEPCYDLDLKTLKIGDGTTTYENLPVISDAGVKVSADGKSVVLEDSVLKLAGFDTAAVGAQPRKNAEGNIEWVVPSTDTVDGLQSTVAGLQADVASLQTDVANVKEIVMPSDEGGSTLLERVSALETKMDGTGDGTVDAKIDAKIEAFAANLTEDGKVNTLMELINYVEAHGEEAANMATDIKTLQDLVGTTAVPEQILAAINASGHMSEKKAQAIFENVKYEIYDKPDGTLVDYRDKEIRVMIPVDTQFELRTSGENSDANLYYIGFKAYAPDGATSFKEDLTEIIADDTMYYFENNDFAGTDEYGRKYSIVWLPVARYADNAWINYCSNSSEGKYVGWYYSVEWYGENGKCISSDCIRINLTNESCHTSIEPYYMNKVVKEVSIGGTILEMVNNAIEIPVGAGLQASEEVVINEDMSLGIGKISVSKLVQDADVELTLDGGNAN